MTRIVLTVEQTALLAESAGPVVIVDAAGKQVAQLPGERASQYFTAEEVAETRARLGKEGLGITTAELLSKLRALESQ